MKKVIDGDKNKIIDVFHKNETRKKVEYYKSLNKWEDIGIDSDGDIILWEEL